MHRYQVHASDGEGEGGRRGIPGTVARVHARALMVVVEGVNVLRACRAYTHGKVDGWMDE